jgi:hypothetical protein
MVGDSRLELEKIAIAGVFHDLGIWTNRMFDYIAPSVVLAREYLAARGMADWIPEIEAMIADHHKTTPSRGNTPSLIESFRRADWIDVSRGLRRFGLPRPFIAAVSATWPSAGSWCSPSIDFPSTRSRPCRWSSGDVRERGRMV